MQPQKAHLERGGKAVRGVALDPEDERVIGARVYIGQGEPHTQGGGLGMQPGRCEGPGGGGKVVPELQRFAGHHLFRGADHGQVCPATGYTWQRMPGDTSVPGTVEIV